MREPEVLSKIVLIHVDRAEFSEYAWNEFESEMSGQNWSSLSDEDSVFAGGITSDDSDSAILRSVENTLEWVSEICNVEVPDATCVISEYGAQQSAQREGTAR